MASSHGGPDPAVTHVPVAPLSLPRVHQEGVLLGTDLQMNSNLLMSCD